MGRAAVTRAPARHVLEVEGLVASAGGREVLHGVSLEVRSGEVHVLMGPNGSGKSTFAHALMGRPGVTVTAGSIRLDGVELSGMPSWKRARAGLFLALQQPIEVPGVLLDAMLLDAMLEEAVLEEAALEEAAPEEAVLEEAATARTDVQARLRHEAAAIGFDERFLLRPLNVDLSGGERKRNEVVQLGVLRPAIAVLDEIDSGLDVDAVRAVARRLEAATSEWGLGVLAVTHFHRLLRELPADFVHVLVDGRIAASGGPDLAEQLERTGYTAYGVAGEDPAGGS